MNAKTILFPFIVAAIIHLLHQAPFIAFLQTTIYAGGIIVPFLFVRHSA